MELKDYQTRVLEALETRLCLKVPTGDGKTLLAAAKHCGITACSPIVK